MSARKGCKKTGGRKKGTPNKAAPEIKALAQQYGPESILKLVSLMRGNDEELSRLSKKIEAEPSGADQMGQLLRDLAVVLAGRNISSALSAARELLDRGFGKPAQTVEGNIDGTFTIKWDK